MKKITVYKRPFSANFVYLNSQNIASTTTLKFDPSFDRVPSTKELVNTKELAQKYFDEVCKPKTK